MKFFLIAVSAMTSMVLMTLLPYLICQHINADAWELRILGGLEWCLLGLVNYEILRALIRVRLQAFEEQCDDEIWNREPRCCMSHPFWRGLGELLLFLVSLLVVAMLPAGAVFLTALWLLYPAKQDVVLLLIFPYTSLFAHVVYNVFQNLHRETFS